MRAKDVKVGMKVVPHAKTDGLSWAFFADEKDRFYQYFLDTGFLIVGARANNGSFQIGKPDEPRGYHFNASDFEPATIEVGDTVRVNSESGRTGVVYSIDDGWLSMRIASAITCTGHVDGFTLVRKAKKHEQPEQKKEEKKMSKRLNVVVVRNVSGNHRALVEVLPDKTIEIGKVISYKLSSGSARGEVLTGVVGINADDVPSFTKTAVGDPRVYQMTEDMDKPVYKVGDGVEVVVDTVHAKVGSIGVIDLVDTSNVPYRIRRQDGTHCWARNDTIKPCPPPAPKTITAADLKKQYGDNVVLNLDGQTIAVK